MTLLMMAAATCERNDRNIKGTLIMLIRAGSDLHAVDEKGRTALQVTEARQNRSLNNVEFILEEAMKGTIGSNGAEHGPPLRSPAGCFSCALPRCPPSSSCPNSREPLGEPQQPIHIHIKSGMPMAILGEADLDWLKTNLDCARVLGLEYGSGGDLGPAGLEQVFSRWIEEDKEKEEPDYIATALGAAFGAYLVQNNNFEWALVRDEVGAEYAVKHQIKDSIAFPTAASPEADRGWSARVLSESASSRTR